MLFSPVRKRMMDHLPKLLTDLVGEYRSVLESRGKAKHVEETLKRLNRIIELTGLTTWGELASQPSSIVQAREKLKAPDERGRTLSPRSINAYLIALKGFCNWMVDDYRAEWSPCRGLRPLPAHGDVRHARRALSTEQIIKLIETTRNAKSIAGIPGRERAVTYLVMTSTGLRVNELRSISRLNIFLGSEAGGEDPYLTVDSAHTKNGKAARINLRKDVAAVLGAHLLSIDRQTEIFRFPANSTYALKKDLAAAGIPYVKDGQYADNHAQRHTFVTDALTAGATPKEVQTLARHHDARLTLALYAHVTPKALRAVVERLPATAQAMGQGDGTLNGGTLNEGSLNQTTGPATDGRARTGPETD